MTTRSVAIWLATCASAAAFAQQGTTEALKTPPAVNAAGNNYLCYVVGAEQGYTPIPTIKTKDQFGEGAVRIGKPRYLCNPVDINGRKAPDPRVHLVCYEAKRERVRTPKVRVDNEFQQNLVLTLKDAELLCVPSKKTELPG